MGADAARTDGKAPHRWRFYRAGGVDQVRLDRGADLVHLDELDQKLWVALSCPVRGLEFDERTLTLLDTDADGRVRAPEMIGASRWLRSVLRDPEGLLRGADGVPLANLRTDTPEGRQVAAAARHVLTGLGKEKAEVLTIEDTQKTAQLFAQARLNGDGVVPPSAVADPTARAVAEAAVAVMGGVPDRSGKPGFDAARLKGFLGECDAFDAWWKQGEARRSEVWPLGDATPAAGAALEAVRTKVDDWFLRGRLAAFDPRAQAAVGEHEAAYLHGAAGDLTVTTPEVRRLPLARVEPGEALPLTDNLNPAWEAEIDALRKEVVGPLLGKDRNSLTEAEWNALSARFAPYRAWLASKAGAKVEVLGIARVRAVLSSAARTALEQAIEEDLAVAPAVDGIVLAERLARCWRDFHRLANNFVSFTDFYARRKAVFQAGTLYLDARSCDLCVQVTDPVKHGLHANMARSYLVYVDCTRPSGERMTVAAAMTAGDSDNLFVGRNGLFYDRRGRDWDATVMRIVDQPISVGQAFWAPYKKLIRWVEDHVAKRAAAADEASNAQLQTSAGAAVPAGAPPAPPAPAKKIDIGVVAAIGVAVGGITAAMGALLNAFFGLKVYMPLGVLGLLLLISGPSMLIAYLKLRRRNLGPLLDANGWAVNTLTRVNIPLGRALTESAKLPHGSERSLRDPYAQKAPLWWRIVRVLLLLGVLAFGLWKTGYLHDWIPSIPDPHHLWLRGRMTAYEIQQAKEQQEAADALKRAKEKPAPADAPGGETPK